MKKLLFAILLLATPASAQEVDMQARVDALMLKLHGCTNDGVLQYERAEIAQKKALKAEAKLKELEEKLAKTEVKQPRE